MIFNHIQIYLLITLLFQAPASYALTGKITLTRDCEPLTELIINGKKVRRLLIDSGATGGIHLNENFITSLSGNPAKYIRTDKYTDAFGHGREAKFFIAPRLVINGVQMNDVPLTAYTPWGNRHERPDLAPNNGVIGLDSFGDNLILIDLQKMMLKVAGSFDLVDKGKWEALPIMRTEYGIEINAIGDEGKQLRLIVDTGTNVSVLFAKGSAKKTQGITEVVAGKKQVINVIRGFDIPELAKDGIDGFIGCNFFKGKRFIIAKDHIYISSH